VALFWIFVVAAAGMTIAQDVAPGANVYHAGWYNALDVAAVVLAALRAPRRLAVAVFGMCLVVLAGVASGLMGPDTHTIAGTPGARVHDDQTGRTLVFPLRGSPLEGRRYTLYSIEWPKARDVVWVDAADARGGSLTITQPANAAFLSPMLMMQQRTTIDGMDVAFDSFSVPAVRRNVKAVLFTPAQAEQLHTDPPIAGRPAILFAVADTGDRMIRGGIGIVASGDQAFIGGLRLRGTVESYPAIVVASAPFLPLLGLGIGVFLFGIRQSKIPSRSKS
jgi:hypothetical protein